jgi:hypothetical protein
MHEIRVSYTPLFCVSALQCNAWSAAADSVCILQKHTRKLEQHIASILNLFVATGPAGAQGRGQLQLLSKKVGLP